MEIKTTSIRNINLPGTLDITVKGQHPIGRIFAPTWEMVMSYKNSENEAANAKTVEEYNSIIAWAKNLYTLQYNNIILRSQHEHRPMWEELVKRPLIIFVCYCKPKAFCHRVLLAEYFQSIGAVYTGEL